MEMMVGKEGILSAANEQAGGQAGGAGYRAPGHMGRQASKSASKREMENIS